MTLVGNPFGAAAARITQGLHGFFGASESRPNRHDKSSDNDVLHNPCIVVDGLLFRGKGEPHYAFSQILDLGEGTHKNVLNDNGFAQRSVDHDTASHGEMSLRKTVSAQISYIATQFVSLPVKIDSAQELTREFDLYVNNPRSQFEVAENHQVSRAFPFGLDTPSDWHGGEESPVTNSVTIRLGRSAQAPRKRSLRSREASSLGHGANPHSSALSSLQTDTARAAFLLPAALAHLFPIPESVRPVAERDLFPTRLLGQAAGRVGLSSINSSDIWKKQIRLPNLSNLLVSPLRAVSGTDEPLNSHVRPASLPASLSQGGRGLLNSFLRPSVQQCKQSLGVLSILFRPSLRRPVLHVKNVSDGGLACPEKAFPNSEKMFPRIS